MHGTFADCEKRLPTIAEMGFNVVYLPPIHPIGRMFRKGNNNSPEAQPGDCGSPWAIGRPKAGTKKFSASLGRSKISSISSRRRKSTTCPLLSTSHFRLRLTILM